ncbi:MAG TPA: TonB-dependent receptor plug domain-containing protein [Mucilaginibacter sp.]|nr:TonB-dependent receptor plug domain-containing protein [Mucilaginibacter sp.]
MRKIFYSLVLLVFLFHSPAYCQGNGGNVLQNIISKLKVLSNDRIIEKAYLQFDKPYYAAGDTMYFKAYVTLGEHHKPSNLSGILHVDLISPENIIIHSIMLQLGNGVAWGDFAIPPALGQGYYRVRAYTEYMRNTPQYFFNKIIPIGSASNFTANASEDTHQALKPDLQFFPEGGDLIEGLTSRVAFKAIGTNGMGIGAKGVVIDNTNTQVAEFSSAHLGMGSFYMEPEAGKTYKAKVTFANGMQDTFNLPAADDKGITMMVVDTSDKVFVELRCNKPYFQDNINKELNIVMYDEGILSTVNTKLDSRRLQLAVPKDQFPSGILQISLFSQSGEPLSERLVFLQNKDLLDLGVSSNKTTYAKREKVLMTLNAKEKGQATTGQFSVSVIDDNIVPFNADNETTILSYLLLTSGLRGYVEQPNYYLNKTKQAQADLDVLMLTQGYRRFTWKELLAPPGPAFTYRPESTLSISGSVKKTSGVPVTNKYILLKVANGTTNIKTDAEGKFRLDSLIYPDGTAFELDATGSSRERNETVFHIDKGESEPLITATREPANNGDINQLMSAYLDNARHQMSETGGGALRTGATDQIVNGNDISDETSLSAALRGKLNGVEFRDHSVHLNGVSEPALIVVDGKIIGGKADIDKISPANVESVELLKGASADAFGVYGKSGVLVIKTRPGSPKADLGGQDQAYQYQSDVASNVKESNPDDIKGSNYPSSNLAGPGHADQVVSGEALKNASTLSTGLNGILRGVNFVSGVPYLEGSSVISAGGTSAEPMYIVVDGNPVGRGTIDNINPNTVETVEVLKGSNASIYGTLGGSGVLVITSRQGTQSNNVEQNVRGNFTFTPPGFYKAREFYSPKYDVANGTNSKPDLRSTIYWQPQLTTGKDGIASFEYYNADGTGTYSVIIEGMDSNGNLGRQVYKYQVQ